MPKYQYTETGVRIGKSLCCGCCGQGFRAWADYIHQDQDEGYGICWGCQVDAGIQLDEQYDDYIKVLRSALNEKNAEKFDAMDRELQIAMVNKAISDGALAFTFG